MVLVAKATGSSGPDGLGERFFGDFNAQIIFIQIGTAGLDLSAKLLNFPCHNVHIRTVPAWTRIPD
jgi:hypothetical protein